MLLRSLFYYFYQHNERINFNLDNNNILIDNCFFQTSSSSSGGSINIIANNVDLKCYLTTFYKCYANGPGGSIYFQSSNGFIHLNSICGNNCYVIGNYFYNFCFLITNFSELILCSITKCSPSTGWSGSLGFTVQILNSNYINSSNNINKYNTGIAINSKISLNNFFTISNNIAVANTVIRTLSGNISFNYNNIINNTNNINNLGLIANNASLTIFTNSFFQKNTINYLFICYSGQIILNFCFIDNFLTSSISIINNNLTIFSLTDNIHYKTFYCEAKNPFKHFSLKKNTKNISLYFSIFLFNI